MDDENLAPQETAEESPPADDDLLNWMPPELVERARYTAEKDAKVYVPKKKRVDFSKPPAGKHRALSLILLAGGALLLVLGTVLAAAGPNGQLAVQERSRPWFALWMVGQAATLCIYLLYLLPLGRDMRRPALLTVMCAGLASNLGAVVALAAVMYRKNDYPLGLTIGMVIITSLIALALTPSIWLLLGAARRRTSEKLAGLMGCGYLLINFFTLLGKLSGSNTDYPPADIAALDIAQGVCYIALLFSWPVLGRPVLSKTKIEGVPDDERPE